MPLSQCFLIPHFHQLSEVSGLQEALNNKAHLVHSHQIAEIQGLTEALNGESLWYDLPLAQEWTYIGSPLAPPRYRKVSPRLVEVQGVIRKNLSNTTVSYEVVATLPLGYRPTHTIGLVAATHLRSHRLLLENNGNIIVAGGFTNDSSVGCIFSI